MRKQIKNEIRYFADTTLFIGEKQIHDPSELPKLINKAKTIHDVYTAAFAALRYTVQTPDHQPVLGSFPDFRTLILEAAPSFKMHYVLSDSFGTIALIERLIKLWDARNYAQAHDHATGLLLTVVNEMHTDRPNSLFHLIYGLDASDTPAEPNVKRLSMKKNKFSRLLNLVLSLSMEILGKEADNLIFERIRFMSFAHDYAPVPLFMKQTADLLWRMKAYSSAAILYNTALKESEQQAQLEAAEVLDAYLCWGLCEIEENNIEEARRIYLEAINSYIESGIASHRKDKDWIKYAAWIHANMAYIYGILADRERKGSPEQNRLSMDARTHIDKALEFDGNNSNTLYSSATLHYDCGEFEKALAGYERYREKHLKVEDRLMAVRSCIMIRLIQLYGISRDSQSTCSIENLTRDLCEYADLFKSAKEIPSPSQDILREIELARAILLNYDPTANLYSGEIGICLLKIYTCANEIRNSLLYAPAPNAEGTDDPKSGRKKSRIAYYTPLANAKYLLERTPSDDEKTNQTDLDDPEEWPDAPKTPPQAKNRLTMMHVSYMNDPNEGHTLLHALCHAVEENQNDTKNHLFRNTDASVFCRKLLDEKFVFMKSFTRLIDQLNMWTTYASDRSTGSDSNGCCICIAPETFDMMLDTPQKNTNSKQLEKNQDDYHLYRVAYLSDGYLDVPGDRNGHADNIDEIRMHYENLKKLFEELNELLDKDKTINMSQVWNGLSRSLAFIAFLFKDASYSAEKELRLILTRDRDNRRQIQLTETKPPKLFIMPPHQIFVDQIILGPKLTSQDQWIPYLQYRLADMWESWPASKGEPRTPKVRKSKISYRD